MGSKVAYETVRVHGAEIRPGDILAGTVIGEILSPGRFRIPGGYTKVSVSDKFVVTREVPSLEPDRGMCAFCERSIVLVEKGKGESLRKIMLPHGPAKDRCRGSKLTVEEARAEHTELSARVEKDWTIAETATA